MLASGCSDERALKLTKATLSGKITFKNKPVPSAMVIVASEKESATGNADENGAYRIPAVPLGTVKIGINTDAGRGIMMEANMGAARAGQKIKSAFQDIPNKFFDPEMSGVTTKIENPDGETVFDIVLD